LGAKFVGIGLLGAVLVLLSLFPSHAVAQSPRDREREREEAEQRRRDHELQRLKWQDERAAEQDEYEAAMARQHKDATEINDLAKDPVIGEGELAEDDRKVGEFNDLSRKVALGKEDPSKLKQAANELIYLREDTNRREAKRQSKLSEMNHNLAQADRKGVES